MWYNDLKDGYGVYNYKTTNEKYEGEWKVGERHGKGIYYYALGDVYEG